MCERVKEHQFTDNEFTRAVNHVIDTCNYPTPRIAEFITFIHPEGEIEPIELPPTPEEIEAIRLKKEQTDAEDKARLDAFIKILDDIDQAEKDANFDWMAYYEEQEKKVVRRK